MQVKVGTNIRKFEKELKKAHRKQIPFALSKALNAVALQAMRETKKVMKASFSTPIAGYFAKGIRAQFVEKKDYKKINKMFSRVDINDEGAKGQPLASQLTPHILGGTRVQKRSERVLAGAGQFLYPGRGIARNRLGNIATAQINKAVKTIGKNAEAATKSKRKKRRKKEEFYPMQSKGRTIIMRRQGNKVEPFLVEGKKPVYPKRFDFYGSVKRSVVKNFDGHMRRELRKAIKTAR